MNWFLEKVTLVSTFYCGLMGMHVYRCGFPVRNGNKHDWYLIWPFLGSTEHVKTKTISTFSVSHRATFSPFRFQEKLSCSWILQWPSVLCFHALYCVYKAHRLANDCELITSSFKTIPKPQRKEISNSRLSLILSLGSSLSALMALRSEAKDRHKYLICYPTVISLSLFLIVL